MAKSKAPKKSKKAKPPKSTGWKLLSRFAERGSNTVATKALNTGWKSVTGKTPPADAKNPTTSAAEAAAWALLSTGFIEVSRVFAARGAARYYQRSTGELPPPMRPAEPADDAEPASTKRAKRAKK